MWLFSVPAGSFLLPCVRKKLAIAAFCVERKLYGMCFSDNCFIHEEHNASKESKISRKECNAYGFCNDTKKWGHQAGADISEGHLNSDDRLRLVCSEMCGS